MLVRNSKFSNADGSVIVCEINHPNFGWIPFSAHSCDVEDFGKSLYTSLIEGEHGQIQPYIEPTSILPTVEKLEEDMRQKRDALLAASDWTQVLDVQVLHTQATKDTWLQYRQALRNIPEQDGFPNQINWPEKPIAVA